MDIEYQNFVDRMGSFEDELDIYDDLEPSKTIVTRNQGALKHYGILGMKWGHHKAINSRTIGAASGTGKKITELGRTMNKGGFNKKSIKEAKSLSDDDLKQLTARLNLENNYINAKQQQSGRSKVEGILATTGSSLAVVSSAAVLYETIKKARE